jgi:hypothetical protein
MMLGAVESTTDRDRLIREVKDLVPSKPLNQRQAVLRMIGRLPRMGVFLSSDNQKLGAIMSLSLPAGRVFRDATCPGATEFCEKICYALHGYIQFQEYIYFLNWAYIRLFPERFFKAVTQAKLSPVFRIHVGGDFFSLEYLELWMRIIEARPDVRFFTYTRNWQNGNGRIAKRYIGPLRELSRMENMRLVLSADQGTGVPPKRLVPAAIRAWLAYDDDDLPPEPVELVFRHKRPTTISTFPRDATSQEDGSPVCPYERLRRSKQGLMLKPGSVTCANCSWCFGAGHQAYGRREDDLEQYSMWAGVRSLPDRVSGMFRQFVPWRRPISPELSGVGPAVEEECACGAFVLCSKCELCLNCRCVCPGA